MRSRIVELVVFLVVGNMLQKKQLGGISFGLAQRRKRLT